jgi:hypothetical protein
MSESEVGRYRFLLLRHVIMDIVQMCVCLFKVVGKKSELQYCPLPFESFLWLLFLAHLVSFVYYLTQTIMYLCMKYRYRPTKIKMDLALYVTYFNFHVAWLCYGNSIVWSDMNMNECIKVDNEGHSLARLIIVLIIVGYIWFVLYILVTSSLLIVTYKMNILSRYFLRHLK